MLVKVRLDGSGTVASPWVVHLPHWRLVSADIQGGTAIVEVPDIDIPDDAAIRQRLDELVRGAAEGGARMAPTHKARWHQHLDRRYREHIGRWRPPLV